MNIAICFDKNLAAYAEVLMTSILELHKNIKVRFYIVHEGSLSKKQIDCLASYGQRYENAEVEVIKFEIPMDKLPKSNYAAASFLRLFLPEILPDEVEKILYLDSDMVVCGDISEFYDMDLGNSYFALTIDENEYSTQRFNSLNIPYEDWQGLSYCNAGMLLMNIKVWRDENVTNRILTYMSEHVDVFYPFADQDVLNTLFRHRMIIAHSKFNIGILLFNDLSEFDVRKMYYPMLEEAIKDPRVVHLYGNDHPWYSTARNPFVKIWRMFADISGNKFRYKPTPSTKYRIITFLRDMGAKYDLCKPGNGFKKEYVPLAEELYEKLKRQIGYKG